MSSTICQFIGILFSTFCPILCFHFCIIILIAADLQSEVNRLSEDLRLESDNYKNAESLRKQLEVEIREITVRLEEAEAFAAREGKRMVAKLQARVSDGGCRVAKLQATVNDVGGSH